VRHVIALDVGGTGMKAALVGAGGAVPFIGGGLAEAGETLFTPLRAAVERRVTFQKLPSVAPAALGDSAGCLGAGLLAWDLLQTADRFDRSEVTT
jgi:glucokinase